MRAHDCVSDYMHAGLNLSFIGPRGYGSAHTPARSFSSNSLEHTPPFNNGIFPYAALPRPRQLSE